MNKMLFKGLLWVVGGLLVISMAGFVVKGSVETTSVITKEFGAKASLKKYEWFIDASNQLEAMRADIDIFEEQQSSCGKTYNDRISREQCMLWMRETAGIKSAYNGVVAEYNSASRKFNWALYNTANIRTTYERR